MISPIRHLNKAFDNRMRLAIMSVLSVREEADFNDMKELLGATDGNLATHVAVLERSRYLKVKKVFVGKKTRTTYVITDSGRKAFADHVDALEQVLRGGTK